MSKVISETLSRDSAGKDDGKTNENDTDVFKALQAGEYSCSGF